ncbi:hypothetical protein acsn021_43020 [Anaerocolumna cellulosilytica]|uniref:Uncharacterized protein n=1 Tax=Anaerocolumna cellulosilytica TaxID=433286 RepID=A0A6S6QZY9_9FIRM|nr:polysaccharide pyruvyl transferase family protein [Anaerocolumna cellulosilytica]MBB5195260.1 hypothetical protein [Anaerocolumna cellulosilytica]BCJ96733.1 hypothetical protein acsn021_43020 [Anaerocolumna cellulosilytica]
MKIGIITFHESNNCGSMLQSYALQKTLERMGYKNEIINFSNNEQQHMYALFRKPRSLKDIALNMVTLLFYPRFKCHYEDYKSFLRKWLVLGKTRYTDNLQLMDNPGDYDAYITGSDQVWNTTCPDGDDAYYLNFVSDKLKIAYAPSFGATYLTEEEKEPETYIKYLKDFDYMSIREDNGAKWIYEMTGQTVPVLLDPTMLLGSNEYAKMAAKETAVKGKYIFYYAFRYSEEVNRVVRAISKQLNMPVYIIDAKSWVKKGARFGFRLTKKSGPLVFLKMIAEAQLVLTTSFHGTAFSIINHKKFWFIDSSMHNANDDRAITILNMFGLKERMVTGDELLIKDVMSGITFTYADQQLKRMQTKSINFLQESLRKK